VCAKLCLAMQAVWYDLHSGVKSYEIAIIILILSVHKCCQLSDTLCYLIAHLRAFTCLAMRPASAALERDI